MPMEIVRDMTRQADRTLSRHMHEAGCQPTSKKYSKIGQHGRHHDHSVSISIYLSYLSVHTTHHSGGGPKGGLAAKGRRPPF